MNIKSKLQEFKLSIQPSIKELKFMAGRIKKSPLSIIGITILLFYISIAVLAPVLAPIHNPRDPFEMPREGGWSEPKPPSQNHPFGLTEGQFDIYYGCIWGSISAFRIGFLVVVSALAIGLTIGITAGYYGGIADEIMMRFTDIILAFPGLILAMALVVSLPSITFFNISIILATLTGLCLIFSLYLRVSRRLVSIIALIFGVFLASALVYPIAYRVALSRLDKVMLALVLVGWPSYTRVIRGEVLRTKQEDYVEAARAAGCSDLRIISKHIVPNAIYSILIMASLDIGAIVLSAAALSFLGLGADPWYSDWGQLIQRSQAWILGNPTTGPFAYWYTYLIPGLFIFTFVLGWNLLGDAFRDILDPTLRRR